MLSILPDDKIASDVVYGECNTAFEGICSLGKWRVALAFRGFLKNVWPDFPGTKPRQGNYSRLGPFLFNSKLGSVPSLLNRKLYDSPTTVLLSWTTSHV